MTCPHTTSVTMHSRLYARETRFEPAEYEHRAQCDDCSAWLDPGDVPEEAEIRDKNGRIERARTPIIAGSEPIKGQVTCQECGTTVDVDDAESVYNAELDDVSFYCHKCTEEEIE